MRGFSANSAENIRHRGLSGEGERIRTLGRLYWRSVSHLNTFRDSCCRGDAPAPPAPEIVIRIVIRALDQSLFIGRARFYRRSVSQRTEIAANCTLPGLELVRMIQQ